jgi:hypothetical protein
MHPAADHSFISRSRSQIHDASSHREACTDSVIYHKTMISSFLDPCLRYYLVQNMKSRYHSWAIMIFHVHCNPDLIGFEKGPTRSWTSEGHVRLLVPSVRRRDEASKFWSRLDSKQMAPVNLVTQELEWALATFAGNVMIDWVA